MSAVNQLVSGLHERPGSIRISNHATGRVGSPDLAKARDQRHRDSKIYIGILKLADVWQRRQSLNARSPPNERLPL